MLSVNLVGKGKLKQAAGFLRDFLGKVVMMRMMMLMVVVVMMMLMVVVMVVVVMMMVVMMVMMVVVVVMMMVMVVMMVVVMMVVMMMMVLIRPILANREHQGNSRWVCQFFWPRGPGLSRRWVAMDAVPRLPAQPQPLSLSDCSLQVHDDVNRKRKCSAENVRNLKKNKF